MGYTVDALVAVPLSGNLCRLDQKRVGKILILYET
jgi:hypothetical protein